MENFKQTSTIFHEIFNLKIFTGGTTRKGGGAPAYGIIPTIFHEPIGGRGPPYGDMHERGTSWRTSETRNRNLFIGFCLGLPADNPACSSAIFHDVPRGVGGWGPPYAHARGRGTSWVKGTEGTRNLQKTHDVPRNF